MFFFCLKCVNFTDDYQGSFSQDSKYISAFMKSDKKRQNSRKIAILLAQRESKLKNYTIFAVHTQITSFKWLHNLIYLHQLIHFVLPSEDVACQSLPIDNKSSKNCSVSATGEFQCSVECFQGYVYAPSRNLFQCKEGATTGVWDPFTGSDLCQSKLSTSASSSLPRQFI